MYSMQWETAVRDGIICPLMPIWDWGTMSWPWIMQKEPVKWNREIRNSNSITSNCSGAVRQVRLATVMAVPHLAAAMAVTVVMAAMEIMAGEVPVEPEICAVICGVRIRYVNVWEEIFVAAFNRTKRIAVMGVLAALSTVLLVLGTFISVNTLFFTAAASFLAGIVLLRFGKKEGLLFYVVCAVLDFIINPNKVHVLLYLALAGYVVLSELTYSFLRGEEKKAKEWRHRLVRFCLFLVIYVPCIIFFPKLFVSGQILQKSWIFPALLGGGVIGWFLYDIAYAVFKKVLAERIGKLF